MDKLYLRPCAGAILTCKDQLVMHKRSQNSGFMPGRWSTCGGHIEPDEIGTPRVAGIREACEESGLDEALLCDIRLRYAKVEVDGAHFIVAFDYEARLEEPYPLSGDGEGAPHWLNRDQVLPLELTPKSRIMMRHYLDGGQLPCFLYDAQGETAFIPMDLADDMRLLLTAGLEGGEAVPLLPGEMNDPQAAARRTLGDRWNDDYALAGATVTVERNCFQVHFSYASNVGEPYIQLVYAGQTQRRPWPGYAAS